MRGVSIPYQNSNVASTSQRETEPDKAHDYDRMHIVLAAEGFRSRRW